ncbi:MAG: MFS transporter [Candidatus Dormibacteraeota bacterium]|uniref:MFS transporter n=1 Tax=Candidatus Aeolococcus gillhamiae TaxID=3127015 RepID=A0A934N9J7_9BACT|nr:MFS transporter [Candidatus Dormibacteraeota bacterium]
MEALLFLGLIWFVGVNLRTVILTIPPLLPDLRHDLSLSYSAAGLLISLPGLCMGLGAVPGAVLIERFGARAVVAACLLILAVAGAARGVGPVAPLFVGSVVAYLAVAFMQPAIAVALRTWRPAAVRLGTSIYASGLMAGAILAAALSSTILTQLFGSWHGVLILWTLPILIALTLWMRQTRGMPGTRVRPGNWRGGWLDGAVWRIGILFGLQSVVFFSAGWLPTYYQTLGLGREGAAAVFTVFTCAQFLATLLYGALTSRLPSPRVLSTGCSILAIAALIAVIWLPLTFPLLWSAVLAGALSVIFTICLTLPAQLAPLERVGAASSLVLTVGYLATFLGAFAGGAAWDALHQPAATFYPALGAAVVMVGLAASVPEHLPGRLAMPVKEASECH